VVATPSQLYHRHNWLKRNWECILASPCRFSSSFPDATATVDDLLADGDKVPYRITLRGTHKGEFMGIPATNNTPL
jgi:predicted ester cyclase